MVFPGVELTFVFFAPRSAFKVEDFPTFGYPTNPTVISLPDSDLNGTRNCLIKFSVDKISLGSDCSSSLASTGSSFSFSYFEVAAEKKTNGILLEEKYSAHICLCLLLKKSALFTTSKLCFCN